jgi:hypothetical protein
VLCACINLHGPCLHGSDSCSLHTQADVGDPQVVSNSLAPFMSLATVVTGAPGAPAPAPEAAQPSTSASTPAIAGASGGEVAEEAVTASTAGTDEKPADKKPVE